MGCLRAYFILFYFLVPVTIYAQETYLEEGFENNMPDSWEEVDVSNGGSWEFQDGGTAIQGDNYPDSAYEGSLNALFAYMEERVTKLVTPSLDLTEANKAELQFAHAMDSWGDDVDELRIYYREHTDSSWKLLEEYTLPVSNWTIREIQLPDSTYSSDYQIAFEATSGAGAGVCIDDVKVIETGVIPMKLESIECFQASEDFIPAGSSNNPILRMDFEVSGNSGDIYLDSLVVTSLNSDDTDLKPDGVKLYATEDSVFSSDNFIGQVGFDGSGKAVFDNLDYTFSYGETSVWVTYDTKNEIDQESHLNTLDAKIESNSIKVNNKTYPYSPFSPEGSRRLYESLFYESFGSAENWTFSDNGEFQIAVPQGLGSEGSYGYFSSDPDSIAVSGSNVLGTDLTGLNENEGDYEPNLSEREYYAVSRAINCDYYQSISVNYYRWLNIEMLDKASVDLIINDEDTVEIWSNEGSSFNDDKWTIERLNISNYATRTSEIKVAYSLGPTGDDDQYGGWNIDDFSVTGDYIAQDIGVVDWLSPQEGSGLSAEEQVEVVVKNFGGEDFTESIPLAFSVDGGETMQYDTIEQTLPVGDSITVTFEPTADFSQPGLYDVFAETTFGEDEDKDNDRFAMTLYSYSSENIPYSNDFEQNDGYWYSQGEESWEHGKPNGDYIDSAASGENVWMTRLDESYPVNDSSFIESPAFDFSGTNKPVVELSLCGDVREEADGLKLQYSTDGNTWNDVDSATHSNWAWYNNEVEALNSPGWSHGSAEWETVRQFLPEEVTNHSSVKLRFLFQSGGDFSDDDGYAIDDVSIYDSPVDVGVDEIIAPVSQCELSDSVFIELAVKNFGVQRVLDGEKISLKVDFDNETTVADTFRLDENLDVDDTLSYVLSESVDMSEAGDYEITAYTTVEDDPALYGDPSNDTTQTIVSVLGMPNYDLGHSIGTDNPDTVTLDAGDGYDDYQWHDGGPADRFYDINTHGTYTVTVTNAENCTATDSVIVMPSNTDIGVVEVYDLSSDCEYSDQHSVEVAVENFGEEAKYSGVELPLGYSINGDVSESDTLELSEDLQPGDTAYYTFSSVDLSEPMEYDFQFFTAYDGDIDRQNDTLSESIEVYGYPEVDLGADSIFTSRADTLELNAGDGYGTYEWQDASTDSIFDVTSKADSLYYVTVTDVHECGEDSDSVQIISDDFSVSALLEPVSSCELSEQEYPEIEITNESQNTYPENTQLLIGYQIDEQNEEFKTDTIFLNQDLGSGSSFTYEFSESVDMSESGEYALTSYVTYRPDIDQTNDTLQETVSVYGYPEVDLGYDTIYTTEPDTITLNAGSGFKEYEWQDGSVDSIYEVTALQSETYSVNVTAYHGCGTAQDSVVVVSNDLAVSDLIAPESDCSHSENEDVKVEISNTGNDTLIAGETVEVAYSLDNQQPVANSVELSDTLFPGENIDYIFEEKLDLTNDDHNELLVYLDYKDVNTQNDTLKEDIFTHGYPEFSIGNYNDTILSTRPDTLQFVIEEGYASYEWQDGTMNDTFNVTSRVSNEYSVTVTDVNGCASRDSVFVSAYDLGIDTVLEPQSACDLSESETIEAEVRNFGADTLPAEETIPVGYQIDNESPSEEMLTLQDTLFPDSSLRFSYEQTADFSDKKLYELQAYTNFDNDANTENDAFISEIDVYGPALDLGNDTTVQSPTYELNAGSGFESYEWHDGSSGQTFTADAHDDYESYSVTVTNDLGCSASDTVFVWFDISPVLAVTDIKEPMSGCKQDDPHSVVVDLKNEGELDILEGTELYFKYRLDQENIVTESISLDSDFQTGESMEYEFDQKVLLDQGKTYQLRSFVDIKDYDNTENDTAYKDIDIRYPKPEIAGKDTLVLQNSDFPYVLSVESDYSSVEWQDGSSNNSYEVTDYGTYWVNVVDSYGCTGSDTVVITDEEQVSVDRIDAGDYSIEVYPNPVKRMLNLKIQSEQEFDLHVSLISMEGTVHYIDEIEFKEAGIMNIPVKKYSAGYYQLKIQSDEQVHVVPIIIQ
ncbi:MAG: T9SS type A sorting domain-containing protein [Bacteroidota bacterium]